VPINRVHFSSASIHWATPQALYQALNEEFEFDDDPCPHGAFDEALAGKWGGLTRPWGSRTYLNPPYGKQIELWLRKAYHESLLGKLIVVLIPSRTDTQWWHNWVMRATEIRFLRGRLRFGGAESSAPFPSALAIFRGEQSVGGPIANIQYPDLRQDGHVPGQTKLLP